MRHRRHRVRAARSRRRRGGLTSRPAGAPRGQWDDISHRRRTHDRARRDVRRQPHPEPPDRAVHRAIEHARVRLGQADRHRRPERLGRDVSRARHPGHPRGGRAGRHRPVGDARSGGWHGTSPGQPSTATRPPRSRSPSRTCGRASSACRWRHRLAGRSATGFGCTPRSAVTSKGSIRLRRGRATFSASWRRGSRR